MWPSGHTKRPLPVGRCGQQHDGPVGSFADRKSGSRRRRSGWWAWTRQDHATGETSAHHRSAGVRWASRRLSPHHLGRGLRPPWHRRRPRRAPRHVGPRLCRNPAQGIPPAKLRWRQPPRRAREGKCATRQALIEAFGPQRLRSACIWPTCHVVHACAKRQLA